MVTKRIEADIDVQYILVLNSMKGGIENCQEFGPFDTKEELMAFYEDQKAPEPYSDEGPDMFNFGTKKYCKTFKKDGPLEWMNALTSDQFETPGYYGHGIHEVLNNLRIIKVIY